MTDAVKGRTLTEALDLFDRVHDMLTTPSISPWTQGASASSPCWPACASFPRA